MPLFNPNTGIKTKLCNLKYTPNTVVAVSVKETKIKFMPYVITDPIACTTIDGKPTL